jgi:hypothetical protein
LVTFSKARRIAEAWIDIVTDGNAALDRDLTIAKPYGWLFCWNSKEFLADRTMEENALVGNVPIFVDRVNGELLCVGPVGSAGPRGVRWFAEYEASIPPARLQMTPEQPHWES